MSDRGVSETLGFVLVFSIIVATIGIVYASGISGLSDAQDAEKVENVGRAFDVLADNLEDLHRRGAPSRATEVKLAGGNLRTAGERVQFRIRAENSTDPNHNFTTSMDSEPIVYADDDGTSLVYENGAVIRSDPAGSAMLSEPEWIVGPNRSVLPLINTYGGGRGGVGGDGAVLVVAERGSRSLHGPFTVGGGSTAVVNVTVESPRPGPWKRYFEASGFTAIDGDASDGVITYRFQTQELYVSTTGVEVTFNR